MTSPTIMLLDDDANTLIALRAVLEKLDARVFESVDEESALDQCTGSVENVDLLVADVILRKSNGPEVARRIKSRKPGTRLLFISGFGLSELKKRGLLRSEDLVPGNVDFLPKPFTAEAFLASVHELLSSECN